MAAFRLTRAGLAGTLVLLVVVAACVRLGIWQLDRLEQRRQRNALVSTRMAAAPIQLSGAVRDTAGLLYRRAELRGTFDHLHSVVLPGRARQGVPGVHLLTPLLLDDAHTAVLVNRGWVPSPDAATIDLAPFDSPRHAQLEALVVPFPRLPGTREHASTDAPTTDTLALGDGSAGGGSGEEQEAASQRILYGLDFEALLARLPYHTEPVYLQALPREDREDVRQAYPVRLDAPPLDEGPHLGYAIQWFSFAVIAIGGWATLVFRRSRPNGRAPTRPTRPTGSRD